MKKILFIYLSIFLFVFNCFRLNSQGNYNGDNFGNQSILLSGNVTGSVDDLGLTYYNPARIALVENPAFSINAQGYQINSVEIENAFGNDRKLQNANFNAIPSMFAGTFKIKSLEGHHFAYSFISKRRLNTEIQYSSGIKEGDYIDEIDGLESFVGNVNLRNRETDEWVGLTWGKLIAKDFSIGVSGFVSIYNHAGRNKLLYSILNDSEDVLLYNNNVAFDQSSYGMFWKIGLAWKLPKMEFGLNIDLPYWEIISSGEFSYEEFSSGSDDDIFIAQKFDDLETTRKAALGISLGAGIPIKKNMLHVKIDWHDKISEYDRMVIPVFNEESGEIRSFFFKDELKSVINFGAGAEIYINEKYNAYASFSTDFSPTESNANIFDLISDDRKDVNLSLDYYHIGFGIDMHLSWAKLVLGATYSSGSTIFVEPVDFPKPNTDNVDSNDMSTITLTRWRFIIGLEIPIFGYKVEVK